MGYAAHCFIQWCDRIQQNYRKVRIFYELPLAHWLRHAHYAWFTRVRNGPYHPGSSRHSRCSGNAERITYSCRTKRASH